MVMAARRDTSSEPSGSSGTRILCPFRTLVGPACRYSDSGVLPACRNRMIVDFRKAVGSHVLYSDYGPTYTGIATSPGLRARLDDHQINPRQDTPWTRFRWFAFGEFHELRRHDGWGEVSPRDGPVVTDTETNVHELEAVIVQLLGTPQSQMRFHVAKAWEHLAQCEAEELYQGGKVDTRGFPRRWVKRGNEKPSTHYARADGMRGRAVRSHPVGKDWTGHSPLTTASTSPFLVRRYVWSSAAAA